jgi:hypothetical protein
VTQRAAGADRFAASLRDQLAGQMPSSEGAAVHRAAAE